MDELLNSARAWLSENWPLIVAALVGVLAERGGYLGKLAEILKPLLDTILPKKPEPPVPVPVPTPAPDPAPPAPPLDEELKALRAEVAALKKQSTKEG